MLSIGLILFPLFYFFEKAFYYEGIPTILNITYFKKGQAPRLAFSENKPNQPREEDRSDSDNEDVREAKLREGGRNIKAEQENPQFRTKIMIVWDNK